MKRKLSGGAGFVGVVLGIAIVGWAHVSMGGNLRVFLQPEALAVVFGGTLAALMISFPGDMLKAAVAGALTAGRQRPAPLELLVPAFMNYARVARRHGLAAVEQEALQAQDAYLVRALTLSASGLPIELVKDTLEIEARVTAEREEERAQVLEAAAGYAPTLGIVGAVLGLMRVMQHFDAAVGIGPGIAAAFVATVYGVGAANLIFLPLATRLRAASRTEVLRRDLVIHGVLALREGASPGVVEERLAGYLRPARTTALPEVA
jgi:chemotaxis protein MotA